MEGRMNCVSYVFWFWDLENECVTYWKRKKNGNDFSCSVYLGFSLPTCIEAVWLAQGFIWMACCICCISLVFMGFSKSCWPYPSLQSLLPLVAWTDQLRLLEKAWGDTGEPATFCRGVRPVPVPILGLYPLNTLPWCDLVGSSPKVKDLREERLFWAFWQSATV